MKKMGIYRKIDDLGRIVIPIELREKLGIQKQDELEIHVEGSRIIMVKETQTCIFCNSTKELAQIQQKHICASCRTEMNTI